MMPLRPIASLTRCCTVCLIPCQCLTTPTATPPQEVVRAVHSLLDTLGPAPVVHETNAANLKAVPRRKDVRIDDFTIEVRTGMCGFW